MYVKNQDCMSAKMMYSVGREGINIKEFVIKMELILIHLD
jgi:hypothetical protein